jgi:RNA polymerase sigma-70 factor (ECF subfamily)
VLNADSLRHAIDASSGDARKNTEQEGCGWNVCVEGCPAFVDLGGPGCKAFDVVPSHRLRRLSILRTASETDQGNRRDLLAEEVAGFFDQFRGALLRYLSSFGLALPDGEEVLQEVFIALFQHLRGGKSRENIRLLAVVAALPEQDRRCLFLRAEGLRYREIAEILDMSLGGVSLSLARSLVRLARCEKRCSS